jgi:replicative superfamily II helicase
MSYIDKIESIDLLVVDEFYKADVLFDPERAPNLIRAIIKLGDKAKQKYYLAPNIKNIRENPFTRDMEFVENLGFNTVYLEKHELYRSIGNDEQKKEEALLSILKERETKTLIYAGTFSEIAKVSTIINDNFDITQGTLLTNFSDWLAKNYSPHWELTKLVQRGVGIHNGRLHRSISQIQVKLFEEPQGLKNIISTSSIIEGVNTSAENVVIWRNRSGKRNSKLTDFSYKNIIGRGGRMFKYFIGQIYLLEAPPSEKQDELDLSFPETLMADVDEERFRDSLSQEQIAKIIAYKEEMRTLLGANFDRMIKNNMLPY